MALTLPLCQPEVELSQNIVWKEVLAMKEKEKAKMIQLLKRESQKPDGLHRKPEDQVKIIIVNKRVNKAAI